MPCGLGIAPTKYSEPRNGTQASGRVGEMNAKRLQKLSKLAVTPERRNGVSPPATRRLSCASHLNMCAQGEDGAFYLRGARITPPTGLTTSSDHGRELTIEGGSSSK
ncbi:hypothetical protein TcWFU_007645 [Taenia crassiceps]|uniref:Uncharacterized protein n=1 Tax=Taenia crassiceps TaxID=6207 RepID=A0ABR4Q5Y3_9CEST